MLQLNLPPYAIKLREKQNYTEIYDQSRKKFVKLTPEEWVRQHFINYLTTFLKYPLSLIAVEKNLKYNRLKKKADIIVYSNNGKPKIIVECKAPEITITQDTFDQAARYNFEIKAEFLIVTNGLQHYCCKMNYTENSYEYVDNPPAYDMI